MLGYGRIRAGRTWHGSKEATPETVTYGRIWGYIRDNYNASTQ